MSTGECVWMFKSNVSRPLRVLWLKQKPKIIKKKTEYWNLVSEILKSG